MPKKPLQRTFIYPLINATKILNSKNLNPLVLILFLVINVNNNVNAEILIADDFNDGVIDSSKWITSGYDVTEHDGVIDLQANVTDNVGNLSTVEFSPANKLKLEIVHTMHNNPSHTYLGSNLFFFPGIYFAATNPDGGFGISWRRSSYSPDNCNVSENFNRVVIPGFGNGCFAVSNLVSSDYYDQQITSVITYDTATGIISLDMGNDGVVDFTATAPQGKRFPIKQVNISTYGWWTGHWHKIDRFKLTSEDSNQAGIEVSKITPTEAVKNNYTIFTVAGQNLADNSIKFELPGCLPTNTEYDQENASTTKRQFRCMPTKTGGKVGRIYSTTDSKLLKVFHVNVLPKTPTIDKISPETAYFNLPTLFTVSGKNLTSNMRFSLDNCDNIQEVGVGTTNKRYFQCTPKNNEGVQSGSISSNDNAQLTQFSVTVNSNIKPETKQGKLVISLDKDTKLSGKFPIGTADLATLSDFTYWHIKVNGNKIYSGMLGDSFDTNFKFKTGWSNIDFDNGEGHILFAWDQKNLSLGLYGILSKLTSSIQQQDQVSIEIIFDTTKSVFTAAAPKPLTKKTTISSAQWSHDYKNVDSDDMLSPDMKALRDKLVNGVTFPVIESRIDLFNKINLTTLDTNEKINLISNTASISLGAYSLATEGKKKVIENTVKLGLDIVPAVLGGTNLKDYSAMIAQIVGGSWDCYEAAKTSGPTSITGCLTYVFGILKDYAASARLNNNLEQIYAHRIAKEVIKQYLANGGSINKLAAQVLPATKTKNWENVIKEIAENMDCRTGELCEDKWHSEDYDPLVVNKIIQNQLAALRLGTGYGEYFIHNN